MQCSWHAGPVQLECRPSAANPGATTRMPAPGSWNAGPVQLECMPSAARMQAQCGQNASPVQVEWLHRCCIGLHRGLDMAAQALHFIWLHRACTARWVGDHMPTLCSNVPVRLFLWSGCNRVHACCTRTRLVTNHTGGIKDRLVVLEPVWLH